jgi:hypothetical protein
LRQSGAAAEDIERAELSSIELVPGDARGFVAAARALAQDKNYGRALALCRQAALREPGAPQAYAAALGYAELAHDAPAMSWAASRLLSQDWPMHNKQLHQRALQKVESLAVQLEQQGQRGVATRLRESVSALGRRDLVVQLAWQGDADLDLRVQEPCGSVCSALRRQTVGGGTLLGDRLAQASVQTYVAAAGFEGSYTVTVERVWGRALADKAQLKVIRHQGTPQETEQLLSIDMKSRLSQPLVLSLEGGRRTEAAEVPSEAALVEEPTATATAAEEHPDAVLHQLRVLSDPELIGYEGQGMRGGVSSPGSRPLAVPSKDSSGGPSVEDRTLYQTRVQPFVSNSVDVTMQAVISADRRYVRVSLTPMFSGVTGVFQVPGVSNPILPGFHLPGRP